MVEEDEEGQGWWVGGRHGDCCAVGLVPWVPANRPKSQRPHVYAGPLPSVFSAPCEPVQGTVGKRWRAGNKWSKRRWEQEDGDTNIKYSHTTRVTMASLQKYSSTAPGLRTNMTHFIRGTSGTETDMVLFSGTLTATGGKQKLQHGQQMFKRKTNSSLLKRQTVVWCKE